MTLGICTALVAELLLFTDVTLYMFWWQLAYIVLIVLTLIHISCLIFFIPDSPHSYIERGKTRLAKATLRKVMDHPVHVIDEFSVTRMSVRIDPESTQGIKIALCKSKAVCAGALSTCGYDYSVNYSITLYINDSKLVAVAIGSALLASTVILNLIVLHFSESEGHAGMYRKLVFVVGLCLLGVINLIHALIKVAGSETDVSHITLIFLFFCVYQCTVGPFYWIYLPEVLKIKDICYPMAFMWGIQCVTAITFTFKYRHGADESYYFVFGSFSLIMACLIHRYAIETKARPWNIIAAEL